MKTISIFCLGLLLTGTLFSCTPDALLATNDVPLMVDTGDDDSVRPDNDKD